MPVVIVEVPERLYHRYLGLDAALDVIGSRADAVARGFAPPAVYAPAWEIDGQ